MLQEQPIMVNAYYVVWMGYIDLNAEVFVNPSWSSDTYMRPKTMP